MPSVEAPTYYHPQPADPPAVFLAGGVTGVAEPWHEHAVETLLNAPHPLVVLNPHRANCPIAVGASPGHPREADVRMLCRLAWPELPVHSNLDEVLHATIRATG